MTLLYNRPHYRQRFGDLAFSNSCLTRGDLLADRDLGDLAFSITSPEIGEFAVCEIDPAISAPFSIICFNKSHYILCVQEMVNTKAHDTGSHMLVSLVRGALIRAVVPCFRRADVEFEDVSCLCSTYEINGVTWALALLSQMCLDRNIKLCLDRNIKLDRSPVERAARCRERRQQRS